MYKQQRQGWQKHIDFIIVDLLCLAISYGLAYWIRQGSSRPLLSDQMYVNIGIILLAIDFLVVVLFNIMHNVLGRGLFKEIASRIKEDGLVISLISVYLFSVKDAELVSRIVLWLTVVVHGITSCIAILAWKRMLLRTRTDKMRRSMLLVADATTVKEAIDNIREDLSSNIEISGIVVADNAFGDSIDGIPVVCSLEDAPEYICRKWIDEVYISTLTPPIELIERCKEMGVTVHRKLHTAGGERQFVERMAGGYVVTSTMNSATPNELLIKRMMDILGGLIGSMIALVIMAVIGPRIKKASPGPILFKQERVGQNGRRFKMYKIRSMYMDAEERTKEEMMSSPLV